MFMIAPEWKQNRFSETGRQYLTDEDVRAWAEQELEGYIAQAEEHTQAAFLTFSAAGAYLADWDQLRDAILGEDASEQ